MIAKQTLPPALKKHEIMQQWCPRDRVHLVTQQMRRHPVEVCATNGALLGTYQRIERVG